MPIYDSVNGVARKVVKMYDEVDGVAREVTKSYDSVNGVARLCHSGGRSISELAVGDFVYMNVDGVRTPFNIIHKGLPSKDYDGSCDGIWVLMREAFRDYSTYKHHWAYYDNTNSYASSNAKYLLSNYFMNQLDEDIRNNVIKEVKVPYTYGDANKDNPGSVDKKGNGVKGKAFLLSAMEVFGSDNSSYNKEGAQLDYFLNATKNDRVLMLQDHGAIGWWLRTPSIEHEDYIVVYVASDGVKGFTDPYDGIRYAIRPAMVLNHDTKIDENFNILA